MFDIFGKKSTRDEQRGYADNLQTANQSYGAARSSQKTGYQEAQSFLTPYAESGVRTNALLDDALGVNGAEGGGRAMSAYRSASNPYLDYQQGETENALMRSFNARGQSNSGASAAAAAKARMGLGYQDYQGWLDRIGQRQGQGAQVAGQQSSMAYDNAGVMRDLDLGEGQTKMDLRTGLTSAMANSRNAGLNNLLQIAGTGIRGYQAYRSPVRTA